MTGIPEGQFLPTSSLLQAPVDNTKVHQDEVLDDVEKDVFSDLGGINRREPAGETRRE